MGQKNRLPEIDNRALETAYRQFCMDISLPWQQYQSDQKKKIYIQRMEYEQGTCYPREAGARRVTGHDSFLKVVLCMGRLFMGADERIYDWTIKTCGECQPEWFCKYENLRRIDEKLHEYGRKILDTHIYYLPVKKDERMAGEGRDGAERTEWLCLKGQKFSLCWYEQEELFAFKENNRFGSAICFSKTQPDVLAVAARKPSETADVFSVGKKPENEDEMAAMAGCSADSDRLWQIGINVDKAYRGQGLAVGLVSLLKEEIFRHGKIPYYGTSESHTVSQTIAYKAGFVPAWTEVFVGKINA